MDKNQEENLVKNFIKSFILYFIGFDILFAIGISLFISILSAFIPKETNIITIIVLIILSIYWFKEVSSLAIEKSNNEYKITEKELDNAKKSVTKTIITIGSILAAIIVIPEIIELLRSMTLNSQDSLSIFMLSFSFGITLIGLAFIIIRYGIYIILCRIELNKTAKPITPEQQVTKIEQ